MLPVTITYYNLLRIITTYTTGYDLLLLSTSPDVRACTYVRAYAPLVLLLQLVLLLLQLLLRPLLLRLVVVRLILLLQLRRPPRYVLLLPTYHLLLTAHC